MNPMYKDGFHKENYNPQCRREGSYKNYYLQSPKKEYNPYYHPNTTYSENPKRSQDKYFNHQGYKKYQKYEEDHQEPKPKRYQLPGQWEFTPYHNRKYCNVQYDDNHYVKKIMYQNMRQKEKQYYYQQKMEYKPKTYARNYYDEEEEEEGEIKDESEIKNNERKRSYESNEEFLKREDNGYKTVYQSSELIEYNYECSRDSFPSSDSKKQEEQKEENMLDILESDFMVLDAVGSADEGSSKSSTGIEEILDSEEERKIQTENIGAQYCHLVYFCSLCHKYLQGHRIKEKALALHCRSKSHIRKFKNATVPKAIERKPLTEMQIQDKSSKKKGHLNNVKIEMDEDLSKLLKEHSELKNKIRLEGRN